MWPFGPPNIKRLKAKGDVPGLIEALSYRKRWGTGARDSLLVEAATKALAAIGDSAVGAFTTALEDENKYWRDRMDVIEALGAIGGDRAVKILTDASHTYDGHLKRNVGSGVANERLRAAAGDALTKIGAPAAERHEEVERKSKAKALAKIKSSRDVEFLVRSLTYVYPGDSEGRRAAAARALGETGDARAVEPLIAALESRTNRAFQPDEQGLYDGKERLLEATARALGQLGDARAVGPLIDALENRTPPFFWGARPVAARALGEIGDARAVSSLNAALEQEDEDLRKAAAWALGKIADARSGRADPPDS